MRSEEKAGMREFGNELASLPLSCALTVALVLSGCDQKNEAQTGAGNQPAVASNAAPASIPMEGTSQ
jgi:hypothetical protein